MTSNLPDVPVAPVSRGGDDVWRIGCHDGDCNGHQLSALSFSASNDVLVRVATENERKQQEKAPGAAALVIANGEARSSTPVVAKVDVDAVTGLRTLFIGSFSGKSGRNPNFEVVLLAPSTIQRVDVTGSGDVVVDDHVLAKQNAISLTVSGPGDLTVKSTDSMDLTRLDIKTEASGDIQATLKDVRASDVEVTLSGSGDVALFTDSIQVSSEVVVTSDDSGDLCWEAGTTLGIEKIEIAQMSSGDVSISSTSSATPVCGNIDVMSVGSGDVDVGGVGCKTGDIVTFGSSDIVVQVSDSLSGQTIGSSGSIRYAGSAPRSVDHSYLGESIASPVKASYKTPVCKQTIFPASRNHPSASINTSSGALANVANPLTRTNSMPFGINDRHLDALLPLGAVALIAALALWKFNRSWAQRRQQSGWNNPQPFSQPTSNYKDEEQPLIGDHRPVYI